jgi:hypothetical protein
MSHAQAVAPVQGRSIHRKAKMHAIEDAGNAPLSPEYVLCLSVLATVGLVIMWAVFWRRIDTSKESVQDILLSTGFFRTVAVMGVIAATVVLSLAGRLEGNITGAILSGIVGYVLGQLSDKGRRKRDDKED